MDGVNRIVCYHTVKRGFITCLIALCLCVLVGAACVVICILKYLHRDSTFSIGYTYLYNSCFLGRIDVVVVGRMLWVAAAEG